MSELAAEDDHLFETHEPLAGRGGATDQLANRLLQRLDFDVHGATLSPVRAASQLACEVPEFHAPGRCLIVPSVWLVLSHGGPAGNGRAISKNQFEARAPSSILAARRDCQLVIPSVRRMILPASARVLAPVFCSAGS